MRSQHHPTVSHGRWPGKIACRTSSPLRLAAMEALFESSNARAARSSSVSLTSRKRKIDNPLVLPGMLSFLTYRRWEAEVRGLECVSARILGPTISRCFTTRYHIMVGSGDDLHRDHGGFSIPAVAWTVCSAREWMLWVLLLACPSHYIANTAGWMTAEIGRQPWLVYGLMRTADGYSKMVSAGNGLFTFARLHGHVHWCWAFSSCFSFGARLRDGPVAQSTAVSQ